MVLGYTVDQSAAIARLKQDLLARGEATDLFGREREEGLAALLGNLDQSVFVEFLHGNGRLIRNGQAVINDIGLAALAWLEDAGERLAFFAAIA